MIEFTKQDVLDAVNDLFDDETEQGPTATAISRGVGYSKKSDKVMEVLESLEDIGGISSADDERGYARYVVENSDAIEDNERYRVEEFDNDDVEIPVESYGYVIEDLSKSFKVTFPNENSHTINKTQRILVINKEKHILISKPEDILGAISEYCRVSQITNYVVRDLALGRAVDPTKINHNPCLIFLTVERHNKAG